MENRRNARGEKTRKRICFSIKSKCRKCSTLIIFRKSHNPQHQLSLPYLMHILQLKASSLSGSFQHWIADRAYSPVLLQNLRKQFERLSIKSFEHFWRMPCSRMREEGNDAIDTPWRKLQIQPFIFYATEFNASDASDFCILLSTLYFAKLRSRANDLAFQRLFLLVPLRMNI